MAEPKYTGAQFIKAAHGLDRDILIITLEREKEYTEKEVERLLRRMTNKEVTE